jgi:hypothetical protein
MELCVVSKCLPRDQITSLTIGVNCLKGRVSRSVRRRLNLSDRGRIFRPSGGRVIRSEGVAGRCATTAATVTLSSRLCCRLTRHGSNNSTLDH